MKHFDRIFSGVMVTIVTSLTIWLLALFMGVVTLKAILLTVLSIGFLYGIGYVYENLERLWLR